jgi:calcineurin-like phosphoesterase family protein
MKNLFLISDTHFGHEAMLKFHSDDAGTKLRPFASVEEMDEFMVDNWNRTVSDQDHVYHLGDVCMTKRHIQIVKRLKGKKRLIMGNHDVYAVERYREAGFQKVMAYRVFGRCILSHVPIYHGGLSRFHLNIHGHLHSNVVQLADGSGPDPRYTSVCVEKINYTPVSFDALI